MAYTTNEQIIQAVTELVDPATQAVFRTALENGTDLRRFESLPVTAMNEFIKTLTNKVFTQRLYDPLRFENPFAVFETESPTFGEVMELSALEMPEVGTYSEEAGAYGSYKKPKAKVDYIYTRDKIMIESSASDQVLRAAFTREGGLAAFLANITKKMFDARTLYLYDNIKKDLQKIEIEHELTSAGETAETAQGVYQEILTLAAKMKLPSKVYNENGLDATLNNPILVLNVATAVSFDVNVFASLFNSSEISTRKYFKDVIMIEDAGNPQTVGYILDSDKYLYSNRIYEILSRYIPEVLVTKYILHNWIIRGLNPNVDGVKLVIPSSVGA